MAISEAEKRRKRFLEEKKKHKDFYAMQRSTQTIPYTIWWHKNGDIHTVTQFPETVDKKSVSKLNSAQFTVEQATILVNSNASLYRIRTDEQNDSVHYIELKPLETQYVTHDDQFLSLVEHGYSEADITVSVNEKELTVTCSDTVIDTYADTDINNATAKGMRLLKFYFTSNNDPSFMIHNVNITLPNLLSEKTVTIVLPYDLSQCSIYTIKLFDKYIRT